MSQALKMNRVYRNLVQWLHTGHSSIKVLCRITANHGLMIVKEEQALPAKESMGMW